MTLFRYPGGKTKLRDRIIKSLNRQVKVFDFEYREPFFGGGSIGISFLDENPYLRRVWINDKDIALAALWTSVIQFPNELIQRVLHHEVVVEDFHECKTVLMDLNETPTGVGNIVDVGFKKLLIHQISYSGLGTKSGGPLGGKEQKSEYKIDCRWSPRHIIKKIKHLHYRFMRSEFRHNACTDVDFEELISDETCDALLYLDPPYYVKGNELYEFGFTIDDHLRLRDSLKSTCHPWVLSYDACPEIKELYHWALVEELSITYSINTARTKQELIISPR